MTKYTWKNEEQITLINASKADAQKIGEALAELADKASGRLKPEAIVDAAKHPRHVLHPHFEWNDKVAGHQWRLQQARHIVSIIRVEDEKTDEVVPAFHSISDKVGVSYRHHEEVADSRELQLYVLRQAERDLTAWKIRYRMLQDICDLVQPAVDALGKRRQEAEGAKTT